MSKNEEPGFEEIEEIFSNSLVGRGSKIVNHMFYWLFGAILLYMCHSTFVGKGFEARDTMWSMMVLFYGVIGSGVAVGRLPLLMLGIKSQFVLFEKEGSWIEEYLAVPINLAVVLAPLAFAYWGAWDLAKVLSPGVASWLGDERFGFMLPFTLLGSASMVAAAVVGTYLRSIHREADLALFSRTYRLDVEDEGEEL